MNILITGATGFVGKNLCLYLNKQGHKLVILTRNKEKAKKTLNIKANYYQWEPTKEEPTKECFDDINAIINLAGENLAAKRWNPAQKEKIKQSRILSTKNLVSTCNKHLADPLDVFISTSAIGYYPKNLDEQLAESTKPGNDFLADVCVNWEKEALKLTKAKRHIIFRLGIVLGDDGTLPKILLPFKLGLGGRMGNGKQAMSWIHIDDIVSLFSFALTHKNLNGIYNAVSPYPITNDIFSKALASTLKKPAFIHTPSFAIKAIMGEMSSLILDSQNVASDKIVATGFSFKHTSIQESLKNILLQGSL